MLLDSRRLLLAAVFFIGLPSWLFGFQLQAEIPVRTVGHGLLVAPVSINGQGPFDFVVDTGTNTTLIDPALAARLGLSEEGAENLQTLTGPALVSRYRLASLAVGSQKIGNLVALGQPMTAVQKLDKRINGILGLKFLAKFSFALDYAHLRLRFYDSGNPLKVRRGQRVAAPLFADRLLLNVAFPDRATLQDASAGQASRTVPENLWTLALDSGISQILLFVHDTPGSAAVLGQGTALERQEDSRPNGCFSALAVDPVCREPAGLIAAAPSTVRLATNQSETLSDSFLLPTIAFGDLRFHNVPAVWLPIANASSASVVDGLLPACLFRSVLYDQATSTIILNPD